MSWDDIVNEALRQMEADIQNNAIIHCQDGSYIILGPDGDTKVSDNGVEYRSIEEIRKGRGF